MFNYLLLTNNLRDHWTIGPLCTGIWLTIIHSQWLYTKSSHGVEPWYKLFVSNKHCIRPILNWNQSIWFKYDKTSHRTFYALNLTMRLYKNGNPWPSFALMDIETHQWDSCWFWWPSDTRKQAIKWLCIDLVILEHSDFSARMVNDWAQIQAYEFLRPLFLKWINLNPSIGLPTLAHCPIKITYGMKLLIHSQTSLRFRHGYVILSHTIMD